MRSPCLQTCVIEACVLEDVAYLPLSAMAGGAQQANLLWTINAIGFSETSHNHTKPLKSFDLMAKKHTFNHTAMSQARVYRFEGVTPTIHWPHQNGNHS